jgi:outer membrane biosynthesis protein TonB
MRSLFAALLSAGLHIALVASAFIYFPRTMSSLEQTRIVPVELVSLGPTTNVRAARPEPEPVEPEPEPEPETPEPEPEPAEPEPEPAQPEPEPEPIAPEPETESEPEPEPIPDEPDAEPEPVEPEPEPEPDPEPQRQQGLDLDRLSSLVDRSRETSASRNAETGEARGAAGSGTAMTATLSDMMSSQIARCVRSSADAPSDMELGVQVSVRLNRDGTLSDAPRLTNEARVLGSPNPYLRVAGQRALRAVIDCAPYRMPAENYQQWRLLEVNVDTQAGR